MNINERVSVVAVHKATGSMMPVRVGWQGRVYSIKQLGYHHTLREGRKLLHVFSVCSDTVMMRLILDTETLRWTAEEVTDTPSS